MTLDSGLRRNDVQGIRLRPDIFEYSLKLAGIDVLGSKSVNGIP